MREYQESFRLWNPGCFPRWEAAPLEGSATRTTVDEENCVGLVQLVPCAS
ncbi:hypothetical protein ACLQ2N_20500 [Streptomyces sp. DT224]